MKKFHTLQIAELNRETQDAVSILFDVPDELWDEFDYNQGQHLTLKAVIDGEELRRNYSICASVAERQLKIAVKQIPDGRFSGFCNNALQAGDSIEVFPPTGSFFTELDPDAEKHYVAFAGGSGITPIMSIIKTTLENEPKSRFTLLYGNRNRGQIIFREDLFKLKNRYLDRLEIFHFLEDEAQEIDLFNGRLDEDKVQDILSGLIDTGDVDEFFICGPSPMMDGVEKALLEAGVDEDKVHMERFISGSEGRAVAARPRRAPADDEQADAHLVLILDNQKSKVGFMNEQGSILDAAIDAGLNVPFACKGGVCATCRAKVLDGEVEMRVNYGLEDDEIEAGYVLTCQSVPKTKNVTVNYDE